MNIFFLEKKYLKNLNQEKSKIDRYVKRIDSLDEYVQTKSSILSEDKNKLLVQRLNLKELIQTRIKQLNCHIFTLNEVHPSTDLL